MTIAGTYLTHVIAYAITALAESDRPKNSGLPSETGLARDHGNDSEGVEDLMEHSPSPPMAANRRRSREGPTSGKAESMDSHGKGPKTDMNFSV